ncbi:hypothetical protein LTR29_014506 [Friedmanniomyces endolithicus]|nr:hypothetical protein LTR29_014506 [Friedmanniomyces endolithicus]
MAQDDDMVLRPRPTALKFDLIAKCSITKARAAILNLPHGPVSLPIFMPVATQGSLKGLTPKQLEETSCRLCLNNTYHLGLKPGQKTLDAIGGAHRLQSWPHNILTGMSYGNFSENEDRRLSRSLEQIVEGSDIIMQLDDVIATTSPDHARIKEAMHRSIRWLDRCIAAHQKPASQNLFCIVQGGLDLDLRRECCREMVARDTPGVAIGGLSGGEAKAEYCKVVDTCTDLLPDHKPRYVMGVGYPEDIIVSIALGADMFDCVWPTRTARFGNAITNSGTLNLKSAAYAYDFGPVEEDCKCICCRPPAEGGLGITRAYIHHTSAKETVGAHLLSMHNVHYLLDLVRRAREAIVEQRYPGFVRAYFARLYGNEKGRYPRWAVDALMGVGVDLLAED